MFAELSYSRPKENMLPIFGKNYQIQLSTHLHAELRDLPERHRHNDLKV
jgi:hypothetical protein